MRADFWYISKWKSNANLSFLSKISDLKTLDTSFTYSPLTNSNELESLPKRNTETTKPESDPVKPKEIIAQTINKHANKLVGVCKQIGTKSNETLACFVNLMTRDSFKLLRITISIFLIIFSLFFLLFAFFLNDDLYERMFDYFINNVEIKNPSFAGRSIWFRLTNHHD